jgi:hypothetical protein
MESDWGAEISAGLPEIAVPWDGFVDLRLHPEAVAEIEEACGRPALLRGLERLNAADSPVFTSKCDVWALRAEEIDPFEFECHREDGQAGVASYIDVILRDAARFASFDQHEAWVKTLVYDLKRISIRNGRVDVTIRAASVAMEAGESSGFGLTLCAAGCGADFTAASAAWETVLEAAVAATIITGASLANSDPIGR